MAKGGWTYSYATYGPNTDTLAGWEGQIQNIIDGLEANAAGWLQETALTKYTSVTYGVWWMDWMHQGGGTAPTGSITTVAGSLLVDGETVVLDDGRNAPVTFEFDSDASVVETDTLRAVAFTGGDTADQIRDALITAITNAPTLNIGASNGGAGLVALTDSRVGLAGNNAVTETVTNAGFVVTGMSGGVDGARIAMVITGNDYIAGNNVLDGSNTQHGNYIGAYNQADHVAFAYMPKGGSGWGAGTPASAGFVPSDAFRFGISGYNINATNPSGICQLTQNVDGTGGFMTFHFICKDDDVFILAEIRSDAGRGLDMFWGMGTLLSTLAHPTANLIPDLTHEAYIGALYGISALNSADSPYSFWQQGYWADPSDRLARRARIRSDGCALTWLGTGQSTNVHNYGTIGTEPYVSPFMYISRSTDLSTQGVVSGNGMKGVLDPEKIRRVQGYLLSQRQTLDGGNFIYIGGNIAIGWDPGNPPMA